MSRDTRTAIVRGLDWLVTLEAAPGFEARGDDGPPVHCAAPYAVALVATAWRRASSLRRPPDTLMSWLAEACDPDGLVRFFGPAHPIIGPDLDDTAMIWSERRALTGWSPPEATMTALLSSRIDGGPFNTWPSPPAAGPAVEIDAVVNANIMGMFGAEGRRDAAAHAHVNSALQAIGTAAPPSCPYYPDLAMLVVCAQRAEGLGADAFTYPEPTDLDAETHLGRVARAMLGDDAATDALLDSQEADGSWPWAPIFIGGEANGFPDGTTMSRPWYGGRAASTALALMALARDLPDTTPAPARGPLPIRRAQREAWEALVGPIEHGVSLVRREEASHAIPELHGPDGHLRLDISPREAMPRFFRAGAHWALGYRGERGPTAAEVAAMERIIARMDAQAITPESSRGPTGVRCHATDASDLPQRLDAVDPSSGPVHVSLPVTLDVPTALPHLAAALRSAERGGPELRFQGLPVCALPWPEELVPPASPHVTKRPAAPSCDRCVSAHACSGPAGGVLRPRTSDGPWIPLRRAAEAWRAVWGYPHAAAWEPVEALLHDLQRGPLAGLRWSVVVVADVAMGQVDPTFRVDAFHGFRDGQIVPGRAVLERLTSLDTQLLQALSPAAERCPIHPAFSDGPNGPHLAAYADTGHLTPAGAWSVVREGLAAAGIPLGTPITEDLPVLGYSVAPGDTTPRVDVYMTVPPGTQGPLTPPDDVREQAAGSPCVATLRLNEGTLTVRKWDVSWWHAGRDDAALLTTLGVEGADRSALDAWLHNPRYGLHPTTLGLRTGGRRIYLRVC